MTLKNCLDKSRFPSTNTDLIACNGNENEKSHGIVTVVEEHVPEHRAK